MQLCKSKMKLVAKTALEIHRELVSSGVFQRETQKCIAEGINVNQGTVSRIAAGHFKRVNKSVLALCKYAQIKTADVSGTKQFRSRLASRAEHIDPQKKKLVHIIDLAMDLLERS